jgi:hypothetical protein
LTYTKGNPGRSFDAFAKEKHIGIVSTDANKLGSHDEQPAICMISNDSITPKAFAAAAPVLPRAVFITESTSVLSQELNTPAVIAAAFA